MAIYHSKFKYYIDLRSSAVILSSTREGRASTIKVSVRMQLRKEAERSPRRENRPPNNKRENLGPTPTVALRLHREVSSDIHGSPMFAGWDRGSQGNAVGAWIQNPL